MEVSICMAGGVLHCLGAEVVWLAEGVEAAAGVVDRTGAPVEVEAGVTVCAVVEAGAGLGAGVVTGALQALKTTMVSIKEINNMRFIIILIL